MELEDICFNLQIPKYACEHGLRVSAKYEGVAFPTVLPEKHVTFANSGLRLLERMFNSSTCKGCSDS